MLEQLMQHYQTFMDISRSNPIVAGAIGLWGAGLVTWLFRSVPGKLWDFLYSQFTTTLIFNNTSISYNGGNELQFQAFMKWFRTKKSAKWSRYLSLDAECNNGTKIVVGMGYGTHFFFHKWRLLWAHKRRLESSGASIEKQEILITVLGRDHQILYDLIEEFRYKHKTSEIGVKYWDGRDWTNPIYIQKRPIETVIINRALKQKILNTIDYFIQNEDWYRQRGMPYKLTYVFHGKPGTGKTSLVKALASHYNRNVHSINLALMSDDSFATAMSYIPPKSFVLIEDFDTNNTVKARHKASSQIPHIGRSGDLTLETYDEERDDTPVNPFEFEKLTLSGLLNTLDGIVSLNDIVLFMSTNHLENIDPALLRKGRVDYIEEIPYLRHEEIIEYIQLMFPDIEINPSIRYCDIAGCDLQALFLEHKEDNEAFINSIPHMSASVRCLSHA